MTDEAFELNCKILLNRFSKIMENLINEKYGEDEIALELAKLGISCELLKRQVENKYQKEFLQATFNFIFSNTEVVS